MVEEAKTLTRGFLLSAQRLPTRVALEVEGQALSYLELRNRACVLAATLQKHAPAAQPPLTAVFG